MRSKAAVLVLGCCLLAFTDSGLTQVDVNVDQGLRPYGSFMGGNLDSISLTNGNLMLHIPLVSYPQRGGRLNLTFFLRYNNKGYVRASNSAGVFWSWLGVGVDVARDQITELDSQRSKYTVTVINPRDPGQPTAPEYDYLTTYNFVTSDGATHPLSASGGGKSWGAGPIDGAALGRYGLQDQIDGTTSIASDPSCPSTSPTSWSPVVSKDPNGNQISTTANGWIDTLGRLIPGQPGCPLPTVKVAPGIYAGDGGVMLVNGAGSNTPVRMLPGFASTDLTGCPSNAVSSRIWNLPAFAGSSSPSSATTTIKFCYANFTIATNFGVSGVAELNGTATLLQNVILPSGTMWSFSYNNYGDLTSVSFPTGGSITYSWSTVNFCLSLSRTLTSRTIDANDGTGQHTWNYNWSPSPPPSSSNGWAPGPTTLVLTDPAMNDSVHVSTPFGCSYYETQAKYFQGSSSSGALQKEVDTAYNSFSNPLDEYQGTDTGAAFPATITTTLSNGKVMQEQRGYDSATTYTTYDFLCFQCGDIPQAGTATRINGQVTNQSVFDYGNGAPGAKLSSKSTTYFNLDDPSTVITYDGSGNKCAETDYAYDDPNRLISTTVSMQHTTPYFGAVRANPSSVTRLLSNSPCSSGGSWSQITSFTDYNDTGTLAATTDPLGNKTSYSYDPTFYGAYVTQTQLPSTSNGSATVSHSTSGNYDFNTGLLDSFTDQNGRTSSYSYDNMSRLQQANYADGGQTSVCYTDTAGATCYNNSSPPEMVVSKKITGGVTLIKTNAYDGLGRQSQTQVNSDPEGVDYVDTIYDALGRVASVSNAYRSTSDPTYGVVSYQYDPLGRVTQTTEQDLSVKGAQYDQPAAASGNGNCIISTDEAGHQRTACNDALGRLIEVDEPSTSSQGTNATASITVTGDLQRTEVAGGAALAAVSGSPLTSVVSLDGTSHTFYLGSNQHVYHLLWTNASGWQDEDLTAITDNATPAASTAFASIYDPSGITHLIYEDGNQHMREFTCCTLGWQNQDLTGASPTAASGSSLTAFVDANGDHVFDISAVQHEFEFLGSGWSWVNEDLTDFSATPILAAPGTRLTSFTLSDLTEHSVYLGTNQHIYQMISTPDGQPVNQDLSLLAAFDRRDGPCAPEGGTCYVNGTQLVAFGVNGAYYTQTANGSISCNDATFGDPAFGFVKACYRVNDISLPVGGSALASLVDSNGAHIYFLDTNGHLNHLWFDGLNWHDQDQTSFSGASNAALSGSALAAFGASDGTEHSVYLGPNQHVYQLVYDPVGGVWTNQDLTSAAGTTTLAATNSSLTSFGPADGNLAHIQYLDTSANLNHLFYTGGGIWQNENVIVRVNSTVADSGVVSLTAGSYAVSVCFGASTSQGCTGQTNSLATDVAAALAQALNSPSSPVTATVSGADVSMTWKISGSTNATVTALNSTHDNSNLFSAPSFSSSATTFSGGSASSSGTVTVTLYTYDALGNLTCAVQKGRDTSTFSSCGSAPALWRPRTFAYDSFSRLLTATNPESGTISYNYDLNGNLLQKISLAPNQPQGGTATQTVSYCYDALNRVTGKAYSAQTCQGGRLPAGTDVAGYFYDSGSNGVGRLTSLTDQAGLGSYGYDVMGRIVTEQRTIAGVTKSMSYGYNLDGSLASITYPSGAIVNYGPPDGAGRALQAIDSGNAISYVTGASYAPGNLLRRFVSGGTITNGFVYNNRLQPCRMMASSTGPAATTCVISGNISGDVLDQSYDFHAGSGDSGNIYGITNYRDQTRNETFTYDALDRLISAQNNGTDCTVTLPGGNLKFWGDAYSYDTWGNLIGKTPMVGRCAGESLSVTALPNNQLVGYGYDAAGNMIHDSTTGNNYTYDAENRIDGAGGLTYVYDADGNRVAKSNGSTGTIYWYMSPGVVAESDLSGGLRSEYIFFNNGARVARRDFPSGAVSYYFSDHLRTASVITDSTGSIKEDEDYYPWGGELQVINNDSNHYKFTGKERDSETGLDYFGARYYSSALGRFMMPDRPFADQHREDPQSWNLYVYTTNNPLRYIDSNGRIKFDANGNVIFTQTGVGTAGFAPQPAPVPYAPGTTLIFTWQARFGYVEADDGTHIAASKATSGIQATVRDASGNVVGSANWMIPAGASNTADCHGTTFANGQVWIDNNQVPALIQGDHYIPTTSPTPGDVGIYISGGDVVHSVYVNGVDPQSGAVQDVTSKGGIMPQTTTTPADAWHNPGTVFYFHKPLIPPQAPPLPPPPPAPSIGATLGREI